MTIEGARWYRDEREPRVTQGSGVGGVVSRLATHKDDIERRHRPCSRTVRRGLEINLACGEVGKSSGHIPRKAEHHTAEEERYLENSGGGGAEEVMLEKGKSECTERGTENEFILRARVRWQKVDGYKVDSVPDSSGIYGAARTARRGCESRPARASRRTGKAAVADGWREDRDEEAREKQVLIALQSVERPGIL
ncbi:hypothetical protein C8R46DRAFT_1027753 [Mycena filopes]|nr:hypothetical protein C8R46DRAFT_1027753 [Mycena filopes]